MPLRILCVLLMYATGSAAAAGAPDRFRDLKVYGSSQPDAKNRARIIVKLEFRNEGKKPLSLAAELGANQPLGFAGGTFKSDVAPGQTATWEFDLRPTAKLQREILQGHIAFDGRKDCDLYVALQGPDPENFELKGGSKITAAAEVVATYAPRTQQAIDTAYDAWQKAVHRPGEIALATQGRSDYQIVIENVPIAKVDGKMPAFDAWSAQKDLKPEEQDLVAAVKDLQRCIQVKSGATLPIALSAATPPAKAVRLQLAQKDARLAHHNSYQLRVDEKQELLIRAATLDGLTSGVYGLLVDHLDCHWFCPGEVGEVIAAPADKTVRLSKNLNETASPSFYSATGMCWGRAPQWDRRNRSRINAGRMTFGHAWYNLVTPSPEAYKEHPDWWAHDRQGNIRRFEQESAWSHTNFCSTHPEVIEMVARKINEQFDADPTAIVKSLDPNDYAPMCLCDRCLALDKSYGVTREDGTDVADRLLHFSREIYDRLKPEHKGKFLGILCYGYQLDAPHKARPHDHHAGMICQFPGEFDHSRPFNDPSSAAARRFSELVAKWGNGLKQMGFYDYYGHYHFFGPWGIVHKMREDMAAFRDAGGTFLVIEAQPNFGMHGLNLYIASRLAWDIDADVDLLVEEFCRKFYGPAAEPMRKFWLAAERWYALERPGTNTARRVAAHPEFWQELEANLREAQARVAAPDMPKQYRDRVRLHVDGFELGRKMYLIRTRYFGGDKNDYAGAAAELKPHWTWVQELKKKYNGSDPYWPSLLADYFYPNLEELERGANSVF